MFQIILIIVARPSLIETTDVQQNINQIMEEEKFQSSSKIQVKLDQDFGIEATQKTICSILKLNEYKYDNITKIHQLSAENKQKRVLFAKKSLRQRFSNVIFTDESIFSLKNCNLKLWYSKDVSKIYEQQQYQYSDTYIRVWAGISRLGKTQLYFHKKKVNSVEYIECLDNALLSFIEKVSNDVKEVVLLQDGAPSHTSKQTTAWLKENLITVRQNSAWSPDYNPIELIWGIMKREFNRKILSKEINFSQQQNKQEILTNLIQNIWDDINQDTINQCISHIKQVMKQTIKNDGEYLKQQI